MSNFNAWRKAGPARPTGADRPVTRDSRRRRVLPKMMALVGIGGMSMLLGGCGDALDRLLAVEAPGRVLAKDLENPKHARLLVDGAVADLECALSHYIVAGGLIGNELSDSQQLAAQWDFDRRTLTPAGGLYATATCEGRLGAYTTLSTARWAADNALRRLEEWTDAQVTNRMGLIATAAAYSGYAHIYMGEGFCSAAFDAGPELTRAQVFERAEQRFTRAMEAALAAGSTEILNMARVGRARARLNLGRLAEAAADARLVPAGFVRFANYSAAAPRAENHVFVMINRSRFASVDRTYRNLHFQGVADRRVDLHNTRAVGPNRQTIIWNQLKYPTSASRIPIARWAEAQLIIAEVEGGQTAVDIINRLHAAAGLPAFRSTDPREIREQVIEQRRRELFLEGHHLGDLIRFNLPLDPAPGTPFVNGGLHGDMRCMPLPDIERVNNPNIRGR
jgi:hypothetical protein